MLPLRVASSRTKPNHWVHHLVRSSSTTGSDAASSGTTQSVTKNGSQGNQRRKQIFRKTHVDFYYDTTSPYSWLAFEVLLRYRPIWNLQIGFKPVFMGGLTKAAGNKFIESLVEVPNKARYVFQDLERCAGYFKVPLRCPESPFYLLAVSGSLRQQRFLTAVKQLYPEYLESVSREFWFRVWSEDMDAVKDQSLAIVGSRGGLVPDEIEKCLEVMETQEIKQKLTDVTEEAFHLGAFGLPFTVLHHKKDGFEPFFGADRFEVMASKMGLEWLGPIPDPENFHERSLAPDPREFIETLEKIDTLQAELSSVDSAKIDK